MDTLVMMLLPVIAVGLGRYAYEGIQIVGGFVNSKLINAPAHGIFLVLVQFGLIQLGQAVGIPLPESLDGLTLEIVVSVVNALAAMGYHALSAKGS